MGDRIAVMKLGVLQQIGPPEELYTRPTNVFVARFIGSPSMNLVPAGLIEGAGSSGMLAGFRPEHVEPANGQARRRPLRRADRGRRVSRRRATRPLAAERDAAPGQARDRAAGRDRRASASSRSRAASSTSSTRRPSRRSPLRAGARAARTPRGCRPRCRRSRVARPVPPARRPPRARRAPAPGGR